MNETRTTSILQRLPVILAVTAASYGLTLPANARAGNSPAGVQQPAKNQPVQVAPRR